MLRQQTTSQPQYDRLSLEQDGVDPKDGSKMQVFKLTGCDVPQTVWFNPKTRTCLPMAQAERL